MTLIPSGAFINWSDFVFTPAGGSPATIDLVTGVSFDRSGDPVKFKASLETYFRIIALPTLERKMEITNGDVAAAVTIVPGTLGVLTGKLADARNGVAVGGGGLLFTLSNAVCTGNTGQGEHAKYGESKLTFEGCDPTGSGTDPLIISLL